MTIDTITTGVEPAEISPWTTAQLAAMDRDALTRISRDPSDPRFVGAVAHITRMDPNLNQRQRAKIITRAKVTAVARALYQERGYNRTDARTIARRVCMSTGAIFASFPDGLPSLWTAVTGEPVPGDAPWTPGKPS